jgi:hypothetical protein
MIIRISPQWQLTIPKALREQFGPARLVEARMERMTLMLSPITAPSVPTAARAWAPEGITAEVLMEALALVARRRRKAAEAQGEN